MKLLPQIAAIALSLIYSGCTGGAHYHELDEGSREDAPRFLELRQNAQVATLHFPAGSYTLAAVDDAGFFYRAPNKILENTSNGPLFLDGGLYLSKHARRSLRGYIFWYGGLVHVGNLTRAAYLLRD